MPRMRRYYTRVVPNNPKSDLNITPFIDVLLVLLVLLILTVPVAKHSTEIDLPGGPGLPSQSINIVSITPGGGLRWNGMPVDGDTLRASVASASTLSEQPVLRFDPHDNAPYGVSAKTIALIKDAGAKKFAFSRLHEHRNFGS